MQPREYVDLDLTIEAEGTGYVARVVDSPAGQASHRFELPFNAVALENFILKLGHSRSVSRRARSPRLDIARSFGDELYRAVFDGEVEICFRSSLREALRSERGLRIRLRLVGAPTLAEIPWEFLYSEGLGRFLVMSSDTPLVRFLDVPAGSMPLTVEPPLRVLVMVSSPSDLELLDVEREVELLRQATADLTQAGAVELSVAPRADLHTLLRQLRVSSFHVFHFIGHGVFDPKEDDGLLMLEDDLGRSRPVSGVDLGVLLHDHHSLRLAVLNACEGARGSVENPLGGVAQTLIRQGLPAAVAMQFEISDEAALVFAHEFYLAIADGYPIDAATVEARKAIFASGNDVEWGTPVLHLRATDGRVFDLTRVPTAELRLGSLREDATRASGDRRFADAVTAWERIVALSPDDEAAALMLERARHGVEAAGLYAEAGAMLEGGRHEEAMAALDRIEGLDPDHGDPDRLRERAVSVVEETARRAAEAEERRLVESEERRKAAADEEVGRARQAMADGELSEARRRLEAVLVAAPGHPDAIATREEVKRRLRARQLMDDAAVAFEEERWEQVVAMVEEARRLDPATEDDHNLGAEASWHVMAGRPPAPADASSRPEAPARSDEPPTPEPPPRRQPNWAAIATGAAVAVAALAIFLANLGDGGGPDDTTPTTAATTTVTSTATTTVELPPGTVGVVPVSGIEIDADPSDWPSTQVTVSDRTVFPEPGSEAPVSARWLVGWDEEALYLLAEVTDPSIDPGTFGEPSQLFRGDSVHFEFGAEPAGADSLRSGDLHVMLAPRDRSGSEVLAAINPASDGAFRAGPSGDQTGINAATAGTGEGYLLEAAVPWPVLGVQPEPGVVFGLNLNVSDGDGSGDLETMVSSNPDRTGSNQPRPGTWNSGMLLGSG